MTESDASLKNCLECTMQLEAVQLSLACAGILIPGFLHNIGNTLVGISGNLDLALGELDEDSRDDLEKRLFSMRTSLDRLTECHAGFSCFSLNQETSDDCCPSGSVDGIIQVIKATSGRMTDFNIINNTDIPLEKMNCNTLKGSMLFALLVLTLARIERNGVINICMNRPDDSNISFSVEWIKNSGGLPYPVMNNFIEFCRTGILKIAGYACCSFTEGESDTGQGKAVLTVGFQKLSV